MFPHLEVSGFILNVFLVGCMPLFGYFASGREFNVFFYDIKYVCKYFVRRLFVQGTGAVPKTRHP